MRFEMLFKTSLSIEMVSIFDTLQYNVLNSLDPTGVISPVMPIPRCITGDGKDSCYTFGYSPSTDANVEAIMQLVADENDIPWDEVIRFRNEAQANDFLIKNLNVTQGVYHLVLDYGCNSIAGMRERDECHSLTHDLTDVISVKYALQTNMSNIYFRGRAVNMNTYLRVPMIRAVDKALISTFSGTPTNIEIGTKTYPHPLLEFFDIIAGMGGFFFFGAMMFNFVIQIGQIVIEKELHLRESLKVMGMVDFGYWLSWALSNVSMNILSVLLLIAAGAAFQFDFFLKNDFFAYLYLFLLFGISMVPVAIMVSTFLDTSSTGTTLGFAIFLFGSIIQAFADAIFEESTNVGLRIVFGLLPFTVFSKGLSILSDFTTESGVSTDGLSWSDVTTHGWFTLADCYWWLAMDTLIYALLALWFDNMFYSGRNPIFFLQPSYWTGAKNHKVRPSELDEIENESEDVINERNRILKGDTDGCSIIMSGVVKTYQKKLFCCIPDTKSEFKAVKGSYLTIEDNTLLCLLGHNGAGKTTTIGMLTGLLSATSGDVEIFGHSIIDGMDEIRQIMGVCPQHDILWKQLTAGEHLELFARIKGINKNLKHEISEKLDEVGLLGVKNVNSGQFSGGMKRRLSVAIALVGNPKFLILDEPTTGMDAVSRRKVWNLIEKIKKDRVTLLTTHSMEEADVLGDKTAIMKAGRIAALGSNLHLKKVYGSGSTVSIITHSSKNLKKVRKHIFSFLKEKRSQLDTKLKPYVISEVDNTGYYKIPQIYDAFIPDLLESLESKDKEFGIKDMQTGMASLEEVFVKVSDDEHHEKEQKKKPKSRKALYIGVGIACFLVLLIISIVLGVTLSRSDEEIITPRRSEEPTPFVPPGTFDAAFNMGIQVADVLRGSALLSLHTSEQDITLHLLEGGTDSWVEMHQEDLTSTTGMYQYTLTDLKADTPYSVYASTSAGIRSHATRFRTAHNMDTPARIIEFGASSSLGYTNRPWDHLKNGSASLLDFFILVGNSVYGDTPGKTYLESWEELLELDGFSSLANATSFIASMNDIEYFEGWDLDSPDFDSNEFDAAVEAFTNTFPIRNGPGTQSKLWRHIPYSRYVDVFVLDTRSERTSTSIVSTEQLDWIKTQLVDSEAQFKFVVTPSPMSNPSSMGLAFSEGWMNFPDQRDELLNTILDNDMKNVFFISGNVGFGAVLQVDPRPAEANPAWSAFNITEILVGPSGTNINPQLILNPTTSFLSDQFESLTDTWTFTKFSVDPLRKELLLEFIDDFGSIVSNSTLELEPKMDS